MVARAAILAAPPAQGTSGKPAPVAAASRPGRSRMTRNGAKPPESGEAPGVARGSDPEGRAATASAARRARDRAPSGITSIRLSDPSRCRWRGRRTKTRATRTTILASRGTGRARTRRQAVPSATRRRSSRHRVSCRRTPARPCSKWSRRRRRTDRPPTARLGPDLRPRRPAAPAGIRSPCRTTSSYRASAPRRRARGQGAPAAAAAYAPAGILPGERPARCRPGRTAAEGQSMF